MYLAYFDESGDSGRGPRSPTPSFTLAAVVVHERDWLTLLNLLIAHRKHLRDAHGLSPREEIKANYLIHGRGVFGPAGLNLPRATRIDIYRDFLRLQRDSDMIKTFAVCVKKAPIRSPDWDVREWAWVMALQRLERFGAHNDKETIKVLPDEGHGHLIRDLMRRLRRFNRPRSPYTGKVLERDAKNFVEDPSERQSHQSYFVQLADLNAYAAVRKIYPIPAFGGDVWDELGGALDLRTNLNCDGPPGISVWPR